MSKQYTINNGETVTIAYEELTLFFNNETIEYGWNLLKAGMTKQQAKDALVGGMFQEEMADAFLKYHANQANIAWLDGKLWKAGGTE